MKHIRAYLYIIGVTLMVAVMAACSVSYKFNGASIDYTKTKTIQIADFPIRSSYVWGPMGPMFNNELKDKFASNTQLIQVSRNGDLKIEAKSPNILSATSRLVLRDTQHRPSSVSP